MAISLLVTLAEREWLSDVKGWRCEALRIPGARIDAAYADAALLDPASYSADAKIPAIRWGKDGPPPKQVTVTVALVEELSTEGVTARWKKVAILMPLLTAIVGAVGGSFIGAKSPPSSVQPLRYHVEGMVNLPVGARHQDVQLCMRPPDLVMYPDGRFTGEIPVALDANQRLIEPPKLLIDSGKPEFTIAVVHILNQGDRVPVGVVDYDAEIRHGDKSISLRKHVEFRRIEKGYNTNANQQRPVAVQTDPTK